MQIINKYTKYFKPLESTEKDFTQSFLTALGNFMSELKENPLESTHFTYQTWELPYSKTLGDRYYNILYIYARVCGVKLMWKLLIDQERNDPKKGLYIIGEYDRIRIWIYIADIYFKASIQYERYLVYSQKELLLQVKTKEARENASKQIEVQRDTIYKFIEDALEVDISYEKWLENIIVEKFRLDYKDYKTDKKEYYHAISKTFHNRRMLI